MMSPPKARKGGKNVLVILLASKGQREFEDAYDVFKDLFAKVAPSTVVAAQLKPESGNASEVEFPPGLDKLCRENNVDKRGCLIKSITNEDGSDNHWSAYYPEILSSLGVGKTPPDSLHFHVSAGSFSVSSTILNLSSILDSNSWVTIHDRERGEWLASQITTLNITPAQRSTFAKCAEHAIDSSGGPRPFTPSELQSIDGSPKSKGVHLSLSEPISKGLITKMSEKSSAGEVQYLPTEEALLEGIIALSKMTSETLPKSPQSGIIITARASLSKERFTEYLREHGFPLQASKVALIVCDFGEEIDLTEKGTEFEEAIKSLTGRELVGGVRTCNRLIPTHGEGDLSKCSLRLLEQIHSIIRGVEGIMIDWSILSTGIPAVLRPNFLRYSQSVDLPILDPIRGLSSGSGARGSSFYLSGMDIYAHRVEVPSVEEIRKLREIWIDERMHVSEALATCLQYSLVTGEPLPRTDLTRWNKEFFNPEEWQYNHHKDPKDVGRKSHARLLKLGAIENRKDVFELTDVGKAGAMLIRIRKEEI